MMVFKRKQIVALSLALMIVVAGYLQYSYKKSSMSGEDSDSGKIGEAVYVENDEIASEDELASEEKEAESASKHANDFFAQAKLDRDMSRSRSQETLTQIIEDETASQESIDEAHKQIIKITANGEKEARIEMLLKEKGYEDALAVFGDDGSLDIVVKTPTLTEADVAKITDIASRHAQVDIKNIVVKNVY